MSRKGVKFVDNSRAVKAKLKQQQLTWLETASLIIQAQAVALVAVDTGHLRSRIDYQVDAAQMEAYVGTNVEYAVYLEFGTGEFAENGNGRKGGWVYTTPDGNFFFTMGMRPQPFLRPAFEQNQQQVITLLQDLMKEVGS